MPRINISKPNILKIERGLAEELKRLEQENKELKEEKQAIKSYLGIEAKTILERLEELDEWKHNDKLLLWKYKSALEEIKGLTSKHCTQCLQVLDIINEVLGDDDRE